MVCGTRPELIKLAPLIRRFGEEASIVYTGQHYDRSMYERIRQDIAEPGSFVELGLGGGRRGAQLGNAVAALDAHFAAEPPDVVNLRRTALMSPSSTHGPPGEAGSVTMQTSQASHLLALPSYPPGQPTGACLRSGNIGAEAWDDAVSAEAVIAAMTTATGLLNTGTH